MNLQQQDNREMTPMQELFVHLQDKFGFKSADYFSFWIEKEHKALRKAYDEGVEDAGYFGNGKDYVDRTFIK
jgi:predicted component of type VI protein secretion system